MRFLFIKIKTHRTTIGFKVKSTFLKIHFLRERLIVLRHFIKKNCLEIEFFLRWRKLEGFSRKKTDLNCKIDVSFLKVIWATNNAVRAYEEKRGRNKRCANQFAMETCKVIWNTILFLINCYLLVCHDSLVRDRSWLSVASFSTSW